MEGTDKVGEDCCDSMGFNFEVEAKIVDVGVFHPSSRWDTLCRLLVLQLRAVVLLLGFGFKVLAGLVF